MNAIKRVVVSVILVLALLSAIIPVNALKVTTAIPPLLLGDVDGDGDVSILDATAIQKTCAQIYLALFNESAADVDGDGKVTVLDANDIQKYLVLLPSAPGIGKPIT